MLWTLPEYFNSDSASSLFLFLIAMSHLKFTASSGSPKYHTHICQTEMRYDMVVKKVLKNQFHEFLFFCQILSWIILLLKKSIPTKMIFCLKVMQEWKKKFRENCIKKIMKCIQQHIFTHFFYRWFTTYHILLLLFTHWTRKFKKRSAAKKNLQMKWINFTEFFPIFFFHFLMRL